MAKKMKFVFNGVVKKVEQGENAGYEHFSFPDCFQKLLIVMEIKIRKCEVRD